MGHQIAPETCVKYASGLPNDEQLLEVERVRVVLIQDAGGAVVDDQARSRRSGRRYGARSGVTMSLQRRRAR